MRYDKTFRDLRARAMARPWRDGPEDSDQQQFVALSRRWSVGISVNL